MAAWKYPPRKQDRPVKRWHIWLVFGSAFALSIAFSAANGGQF